MKKINKEKEKIIKGVTEAIENDNMLVVMVDGFQVISGNPLEVLAAICRALQEIKKQGLVGAIGVEAMIKTLEEDK